MLGGYCPGPGRGHILLKSVGQVALGMHTLLVGIFWDHSTTSSLGDTRPGDTAEAGVPPVPRAAEALTG